MPELDSCRQSEREDFMASGPTSPQSQERVSHAVVSVAVLGARGFVGSRIVDHLRAGGCDVTAVPAPRLHTASRSAAQLALEAEESAEVAALAAMLRGTDVVVNAAGLATATHGLDDTLVGANALLPAVIQRAASIAGCQRLIHVSSAAVQGAGRLDETDRLSPFSPYSFSKCLGELVLGRDPIETVIYRPTSVHGIDRAVTIALSRLARSRLSSVAGDGSAPTPQTLVENVGQSAAFLALTDLAVPRIVLHPWERLSVFDLMTVLGLGRVPRNIPVPLADSAIGLASMAGRLAPVATATARRLELLWRGQEQEAGWLDDIGFSSAQGLDSWKLLGQALGR